MNDLTAHLMRTTFDKCSQEQYDDIESQFENMDVLWRRALEQHGSIGIHTSHMPALELHLGECVHDFDLAIGQAMRTAALMGQQHLNINPLAFDFFKSIFLFGYEVGKQQWPLPTVSCQEVHSNDD